MKKLFALIFALLMFCSCAAQEEPQSRPEIEIVDEVSYTDESGKYGFHKDGVPVTEAIFDEILPAEKINMNITRNNCYVGFDETAEGKKVYAGIITDGTRKAVSFDWEKGNYYVDEPNTLYWFYESGSDSLINETPLGNFSLLLPEDMGNDTQSYLLRGAYEGDSYTYLRNSEGWELYEKLSGGAGSAYMSEFCTTNYYWSYLIERFGIEDLDGNTILEPMYFFGDINVNGKFIIYDGYTKIADDIAKTYIMDWDGNIICDEYDYIMLRNVGDQRFILVANGKDDDGTYGYWFIDDYGNKLSEKFDYIVPIYGYYEDMFGGPYWYRTAKVAKDGIETEISVLDYALDYE